MTCRPRPRRRGGPTFEAFAARFLRDHARALRSDFYDERSKLLRAAFGARRLAAITRADLDRYVAHRHRRMCRGGASRAKRAMVRPLRVLFRRAVEWACCRRAPSSGCGAFGSRRTARGS